MSCRIAYWIYNYMPQWEAASKEVQTLHTRLGTDFETTFLALNMKHRRLDLAGREKHIPLPFGLIGLPLVKGFSRRFTVNHIFASQSEHLLTSRVSGQVNILTVTKDAASLQAVEGNLHNLKRLDCIVLESEPHLDILQQAGIPAQKLRLIYPGVETHPYQEATGPFSILFASSPAAKHDMLSRGVYLMLQVAKELPEIRFVFAWRERNLADLQGLIGKMQVTNVDVKSGCITDMGALYDSCHAAILPGLAHNSLKPCPHSGLEALAHGKPLLVSLPTSIAGLIDQAGCGVTFAPTIDALATAITRLRESYATYQAACNHAVENHFSTDRFLAAYRDLYHELTP